MVQMSMDPGAPLCFYVISLLLGKFEVPEVSLSQLNISALSLPSGILEKVSRTSDPLIDLATIVSLASIPG